MKGSVSNVVTLGRLLAVTVIVAGVAVSAWEASAISPGTGIPHFKLRSFFSESLQYFRFGGLLLAIAEISDRFGSGPVAGRVDWQLTILLRVLGVTVVVGGIGLTLWNALSIPGGSAIHANTLLGYSRTFQSGSKRAITRNAIEFAWQGGLLILAAEIADRLRWGHRGEEAAEEPVPPDTPSEEPARRRPRVEVPV